jgi:hypothetical protein
MAGLYPNERGGFVPEARNRLQSQGERSMPEVLA